jgi:preprotein translocase subunit Sss1
MTQTRMKAQEICAHFMRHGTLTRTQRRLLWRLLAIPKEKEYLQSSVVAGYIDGAILQWGEPR